MLDRNEKSHGIGLYLPICSAIFPPAMAIKTENTPRSGITETCGHDAAVYLGVQRFPVPPFEVPLVHCHTCGSTVSEGSLASAAHASSMLP